MDEIFQGIQWPIQFRMKMEPVILPELCPLHPEVQDLYSVPISLNLSVAFDTGCSWEAPYTTGSYPSSSPLSLVFTGSSCPLPNLANLKAQFLDLFSFIQYHGFHWYLISSNSTNLDLDIFLKTLFVCATS